MLQTHTRLIHITHAGPVAPHWQAGECVSIPDKDEREEAELTAEDLEIARQLRDARAAAKIRQVDLARRLGVTQSTISRIERGEQGTTPGTVIRWLAECGYAFRSVSMGGNHKAVKLALAVDRVDEDGMQVLVTLANAWPKLDTTTRRAISGLVATFGAGLLED